MTTWIYDKRKATKLSQTEVARALNMSRPTYIKVESGERKLSLEEKAILTRVFDIPASNTEILESSTPPLNRRVELRAIPKENVEKFKQTLLYVISKIGSKPNIGQTALYKIMYFIDFDYYEKFEKQLAGATYIKNTYGPTPISFATIIRGMKNAGQVVEVKSKFFGHDQTKYVPTQEPEVSLLSGEELKHIDDEIARLSNKTAKELSNLSHLDTPWRMAKDKEVLDYEYVFYRPQETSVRHYEQL